MSKSKAIKTIAKAGMSLGLFVVGLEMCDIIGKSTIITDVVRNIVSEDDFNDTIARLQYAAKTKNDFIARAKLKRILRMIDYDTRMKKES